MIGPTFTLLALESFRKGDRGVVTQRGLIKSVPGAVADPPPVMNVVAVDAVQAMAWGKFQQVNG